MPGAIAIEVVMRAIQLTRFGGPEVLQVVKVPKPQPGPGELLVRMHAAGVNFFEVLMRQDRYATTPELPMIPGVEVAGVVEAIGARVANSWPGRRVAAALFMSRGSGGYAEYVTIDERLAVSLPDGLSFAAAVALMVQGLTALHTLRRSPPDGKSILVSAAAGGVGTLLVQLAKRSGAKAIVAAASTPQKLDLAASLGAGIGMDYSRPDWVAHTRDITGGVDVIYDTVGGALTERLIDILAPGGELVFGAMGRFSLGTVVLEAMLARNQSLKGFALLPLLTPEKLQADLSDLFRLAAEGELKVILEESFSLGRASEAHRAIEERRTSGKVVLVP
jgi:NADPH2:quinone reductase